MNPDRLGATIFSVGDLYNRLKQFSRGIANSGKSLFFVKVDVQSAFDTIPQDTVLELMQSLPSESEYRISKYVEIKPGESHHMDVEGQTKSKPIRKWISLATSPSDFQSFEQNLETNFAVGKKHTVFVENIVSQFRNKNELLDMLSQHVRHNMVKIGKKFYRQKKGIPQGSVLSSILCNYFYADLEARHLSFLNAPGSLLLRLVDDFLLVTTDRQRAKEFLQVMHDGLPEYGVTVNPGKTLVNFEVSINNVKVKRLVGSRNFPYCGSFIDTETLNITKDRERKKDMGQ
jgi:telomerase reverse transcriptase